jgi:hypothetical protein
MGLFLENQPFKENPMVTLESMAEGAIEEKFANEMKRVAANIADLNTSPTAAREIKITIKMKPTEDRSSWVMESQVVSKLAPSKGVVSSGHFELQGGKVVPVEAIKPESIADILNRDAQEGIRNAVSTLKKAGVTSISVSQSAAEAETPAVAQM